MDRTIIGQVAGFSVNIARLILEAKKKQELTRRIASLKDTPRVLVIAVCKVNNKRD
jgi:hypothetical protein